METKEEKFKRVAENRMKKVFSDMNLIANLSNRKHYTYSVQEVEELFQAYHDKGKEVQAYFLTGSVQNGFLPPKTPIVFLGRVF